MLGDAFWNATRAKNFVIAMGGKPTKWAENLAFLAAKAEITVEQLRLLDPISYAYLANPWQWGGFPEVGAKVKSIIGEDNFRNLAWFYINQHEVAAARLRYPWRMSPTAVYWSVHWHKKHVKVGITQNTKEGRRRYTNVTLNADKPVTKRSATAAAYNRLTKLPRIVC